MSTSLDNTICNTLRRSMVGADSADTCGASIIIPAHNAAGTLEATLKSLVHQTRGIWEAIIVDDGSTDSTRAIAGHWAHRDRRFRVLHQERLGVCAARNRGLREARYPFVLFLDSDDRIASTHLERMVGTLVADSALDAVHCGWQNILASGVNGRPHLGSDQADLFQYFALHCHFAIHACVLRRDLALAVGGFDVSLVTCEDWDFFQRVARSGARFGRVPEVLAFYHIRTDSASRDGGRCVTDARVVLDRGHGRDPRVRTAAKAHLEGAVATGRDLALYNIVMYWAIQEIGAGRDGLSLLDFADLPPAPDLQAAAVAEMIQELVPMAANRSEEDWPGLWSRVSAPLAAFLARLEAKARVPALAFATLRYLEKKILLADTSDASLLVGSTYRVSVDLARQLRDVSLPPQADRLICRLTLKGEPIGALEVPGAGVVAGRKIAEAALEGRGRLLFRRALTPERSVCLGLRVLRGLLRRRMLRLIYCAVTAKPKDRVNAARQVKREAAIVVKANLSRVLASPPGAAAKQANQDWQESVDAATAVGRAAAREQLGQPKSPDWWDRLFALADPWAYESDYETVKREQTLALLPGEVITDALEIACAEGHFTVRLAPRVGRLTAVDISPRALARAQARCSSHRNVAFQMLDLNADDIPGPFDLIVCSEVLYYVRDLPGVVGRILSQIRPGGFFLSVHSRVLIDEPGGIGFAWNQACGVESIAKIITAQPGIALRRELRTPLYRVLLYQRIVPGQPPGPPEIRESDRMGQMIPAAHELARLPGRPPMRSAAKRACSVPILMYHRIAADGPVALARFRVAPDLFAAQIATLHRAGYRAVSLEDWISAMQRDEPLPGKPIILTFDDGYQDFLTAAMPVLRYYGFSATVFLVAERIGGVADWDAGYGEAAPLLSWQEVRALQAAGTQFGCHSAVHRPMTGMHLAELIEDTAHARAILEEWLEAAVTTLAYPYGAENEFVRRVVADLGFRAAASCEPGISRLGDDPLRLRRIEIFGGCTPEQLLTLIGHTSEKDLSDALPAQ
jgi:peptidoglycan/xylan/chitin deacetylase (PgdA/CDA1 family)/glycosyltransferase involved in cell wall biosynthesis/2-polyprenyl-3-methyl-5-hydroxy-6-metoxy-1,4-benzoquinol methylase